MGIAINNIRIGRKYRLTNFGEVTEFEVMEYLGGEDFLIKDLLLLEKNRLHNLMQFGKGSDFEIEEIG
jgi:hypothetical protein